MVDKEYLVLTMMYKKMHNNMPNIFPKEWNNKKEYELKKKILQECIENNLLIINSSSYYDFRILALN